VSDHVSVSVIDTSRSPAAGGVVSISYPVVSCR
jgi:hypothetical protein